MTRRLSSRSARASSSGRRSARAHEAAVALGERQIVGERRPKIALERAAIDAKRARRSRMSSGGRSSSDSRGCARALRRGEAVADRGEIARPAAVEAEARQRAQEIGRARERPPQSFARGRRPRRGSRAPSSRSLIASRIGQRTREPLGEEPRAGRRHREVDRREKRAFARAAERPGELEIGAGRRIDFEGSRRGRAASAATAPASPRTGCA